MRFSEDALYDMETCRDVIDYIEAHREGGSGKPDAAALRRASSGSPGRKIST